MLPFDHDPAGQELLTHDGSARLHRAGLDRGEADRLFERILDDTPWEQYSIRIFGRTVPQPRLAAWYGDPGCTYEYSGLRLDPLPWTPELALLRDRCADVAGTTFNSVLLNLYRDGTDSMGWHSDDEPELGPTPVIASVTLGEERSFHLRHRTDRETVRVVLNHGSILVMSGTSQRHWQHQVPKTAAPKRARINATFRTIHPHLNPTTPELARSTPLSGGPARQFPEGKAGSGGGRGQKVAVSRRAASTSSTWGRMAFSRVGS